MRDGVEEGVADAGGARPERGLAVAATVLAPALLAAGWLALPTPEGSAPEQLADVEGSLARWTTAWLLLLGGALLTPVAAWLLASLAPEPSATAVRVGRALAVLGAMGFVGLIAVRGLHGAQLADELGGAGLDAGLASAWDDLQSGLLRPFVYTPEILAVGVLMLGLAVSKSPATRAAGLAAAAGALVIVGGLFVSQTVVAGVGALVLLAGCAALAPRAMS